MPLIGDIKFEVAFDVDPGDEPTGGDWTDLSSRIRSTAPVDIQFGAGRLAGGSEGSCTLTLDNRDRLIDPTNTAATYNLVPMRHARVQVVIGATTYPLFRGFVDAWPPMWSAVDSEVEVELVDGFAWVALQEADVDLSPQSTSERVNVLLDLAGWPAGLRDLDDGLVQVERHTQDGANLLQLLHDAVDAEVGDLYVAPDGTMTFRNRHHRILTTASVTLGDGGVAIASAEPAFDAARLSNTGRVELANGDTMEHTDAASAAAYGPRVFNSRDLAVSDTEAEGVAMWEVVRFAEPHVWLDPVTFHGHKAGVLTSLLPVRIADAVQLEYTPPAGAAVSLTMDVDRISHSIGKSEWTVSMGLSPHFSGPWLTLAHEDESGGSGVLAQEDWSSTEPTHYLAP